MAEPISLQSAAQMTGIAYATIKKDAQREKLRVTREGGKVFTTEEDLEVYVAGKQIVRIVESTAGQPADVFPREIGNGIANLPPRLLNAILDGIPTAKKPGGSAAYLRERAAVPHAPPSVVPDPDDPHNGYPVGYQHTQAPRWKRTSESTWSLAGATWSWNGLFWEGGGTRVDSTLGEGVSPSNPDTHFRAAATSKAVPTGKAER